MERIAIYGKGGIGKSVVATNLSAACALNGRKVLHIGCDPKHDSSMRLMDVETELATVLETLGDNPYAVKAADVINTGRLGIDCCEAGGPSPGVGCAGRGVLTALQILKDLKAFDTYHLDVVVYDILGDVVCGGFAQPIRAGYAQEIYLLCSGAFMSIYAANNIAKGIRRLARRGDTGLAGVICNSAGEDVLEQSVLGEFAETLGTRLIQFVPRSPVIQACEVEGRTVLQHSPQSIEADVFRELAQQVLDNQTRVSPTPIEDVAELEALYRRHLGLRAEKQAVQVAPT